MPTVTIAGGGYSALVQYNTNDAFSYATALGQRISDKLAGGTLVNYNYVSSGTAPGPATGSGGQVTFATGTAGLVSIPSTDVAVVAMAAGRVQIQGGGAGTSVIAGSGGLSYTDMAASNAALSQVVAGDGANLISTAMTGTGNYVVNTGAGDDTIGMFNGNATVNAATGHNLVVLGGSAQVGNSVVFSEGYDSIVGNIVPGGGGLNTVDIGSGQTTINPGSSNFFVYGDAAINPLLYLAGTGSATVAAGLGASTITGGLAGRNLLIAGLSKDGASLTAGGNNDQLIAVGGGAVTANGGSGNNVLISGAGGTTALLPGYVAPVSTANNLFLAGSGNDTLRAGQGADTLAGGKGTGLLVAGTGADTFRFTQGSAGGSDTISGFKASDTLQLLGYGLSSQAVGAMQNPVNGGTVINLSDGTRITLDGVGSLSSGQIKTA